MSRRVLLAEDEPHIIELLCFLLGRAGYDVATEISGTDALRHALESPPDVLILDVMLPGLNGFELMRQLRADPRGERVPVVMLTAKGQREDRDEARRLAVDVFVTKPFSNAELLEIVSRLANGADA